MAPACPNMDWPAAGGVPKMPPGEEPKPKAPVVPAGAKAGLVLTRPGLAAVEAKLGTEEQGGEGWQGQVG